MMWLEFNEENLRKIKKNKNYTFTQNVKEFTFLEGIMRKED